jgi:hypothetical protein
VRRAIDDLVELFVLKAVDDAKQSIARSRRRERTRTVLVGEAPKLSETEPSVARSQPNKPPTKKRTDSSVRTSGGGRLKSSDTRLEAGHGAFPKRPSRRNE